MSDRCEHGTVLDVMMCFDCITEESDRIAEENEVLCAELEQLKASDPRCRECGGELTACGEMTEDGPSNDCLVCQLRADVDRHSQRVDDVERTRKTLHRDNQRLCERGFEMSNRIKTLNKALKDAEKTLIDLKTRHHHTTGDKVTLLIAQRMKNAKQDYMKRTLELNEKVKAALETVQANYCKGHEFHENKYCVGCNKEENTGHTADCWIGKSLAFLSGRTDPTEGVTRNV